MAKKFYKIVDEKMKSCSINARYASEFEVQYKLNEFVSSNVPKTPLFVFETLDAAKNFIHGNGSGGFGPSPAKTSATHIYECEVVNPRRMRYLLGGELTYSNLQNFWKVRLSKKKVCTLIYKKSVPSKTFVCDKVKLLKKVS